MGTKKTSKASLTSSAESPAVLREESSRHRWIIGVSGASGVRYAVRLIDVLERLGVELHLVFSEAAFRVFAEEEGINLSPNKRAIQTLLGRASDRVQWYPVKDIGAAIASGSFSVSGMVVCPCSMDTLGAVASGVSLNLLQRAADVTIKEGRPLILVPRETPLSAIHLENMLKLARLGVRIVPAMPGFYHRPKQITDLIDMQVMKVIDQMGIETDLVERWK